MTKRPNVEPVVSVVVSCYNYGHYLTEAIQSIFSQTYRHYEIIVVNDGSTDETDKVINNFIDNPKVRYVKQENMGQANAKNNCIKRSHGRFIAFLDADDIWERDKLAKQLLLFENPEVGIVYSRMKVINEKGEIEHRETNNKYLLPRSGEVTEHLIFDNFVPFSSAIVRKECFEKFGLFDETLLMGIDWDLWLRLSVHYKFDFVDEELLRYRRGHQGQMSKNIEERFKSADRIFNSFLDNNGELLSPEKIRKARSYSYRSRGYAFRNINIRRSCKYYLLGIRQNIFDIYAVKGLIGTCVHALRNWK